VHCRDHDVEGMTDGFDASTAYGQIEGYEDASMGWSRSASPTIFRLAKWLIDVALGIETGLLQWL
jgi:hypothetical protein